MARRIRTIKPEILEDEKTASLSHLEFRIFVGSWIVADDHGNLRGDPDYVRGQIVWSSRESRETVANALETLERLSLLTRYIVRGQTYYHVTTWQKHQRIDKPGKPAMPGPDQADVAESIGAPANSRESRESVANHREGLATDTDQEREEEGDGEHEIPPSAGKAKRASRLAADWVPDRTEVNQRAESEAKARGVDLRAELVKLRDWATSTAAKRADWNATWRNWTRNARAESRRPTHANALELQLERVAMLEREEQLERATQEHEPS